MVEGSLNSATGIRSFKGIPFAAPPIGERRWKAPEPPPAWRGVRPAAPVQPSMHAATHLRRHGVPLERHERGLLCLECLDARAAGGGASPGARLFFRRWVLAGDGSEPRYDGEALAREGIVTLTVNYRLNIFGFLAHPDLTKESPDKSSGNYALLDQNRLPAVGA